MPYAAQMLARQSLAQDTGEPGSCEHEICWAYCRMIPVGIIEMNNFLHLLVRSRSHPLHREIPKVHPLLLAVQHFNALLMLHSIYRSGRILRLSESCLVPFVILFMRHVQQ